MVKLTHHHQGGSIHRLVFDAVANADGSFQPFTLPPIEGSLLALSTAPGHPAPSAFGFDVLLLQNDYDLLEGSGLARSGEKPRRSVLRFPNTDMHQCCALDDTLQLTIRGNTTPRAKVRIDLFMGVPQPLGVGGF